MNAGRRRKRYKNDVLDGTTRSVQSNTNVIESVVKEFEIDRDEEKELIKKERNEILMMNFKVKDAKDVKIIVEDGDVVSKQLVYQIQRKKESFFSNNYKYLFIHRGSVIFNADVNGRYPNKKIDISEIVDIGGTPKCYFLLPSNNTRKFEFFNEHNNYILGLNIVPRHGTVPLVQIEYKDNDNKFFLKSKQASFNSEGHFALRYGNQLVISSTKNFIFQNQFDVDILSIRKIESNYLEVTAFRPIPTCFIFAISLCIFIGRLK